LATTDQHGNLMPYDYYTAKPSDRGLVKIATLVNEARAANPNAVLIDCGDAIQGTPLETLHQEYIETGQLPMNLSFTGAPLDRDPVMAAMSEIGYDMMVVGNHEFNFGLKNLERARSDARFPWISANIRADGGAVRPFAPYFVKTVGGVKVGIVGITTPFIPQWETEDHYRGYRFESGVEAARRAIADLRAKEHPDIVIVAAHAGLDRDPRKDTAATSGDSRENMIYQIATEVPGIDGIIFGHTHEELSGVSVKGVPLLQPKNWNISLGRMNFVVDVAADGTKRIVSKSTEIIPVKRDTPEDQKIAAIALPYHQLTEKYLNTPVTEAKAGMDARLSRSEDTALIDTIQLVQLYYSKADVSFASSFNMRAAIPKGPVTIRQIAGLYVYDNTLWVLEGTGKMVREALENSARYFESCSSNCVPQSMINHKVIGYNFDMAEGVDYEIDLSKPAGQRIVNLRFHGKALEDAQPLRIALNNYRAGGSAGYTMFVGAKVISKSPDEIRDLMIRYYREHPLPDKADGNWRIVPDAAREAVLALGSGAAGSNQ
jgi:2',3'-cyclic-nucleotide 2'-phosphodiesterase/3'-nucleotidase